MSRPVANQPDPPIVDDDWQARVARLGATGPPASNGQTPDRCTEELRRRLLHGDAILEVPPPEPLVDGVLDQSSVAVLYGAPKTGKTFLALDLALCVATGSWWKGHEVTRGHVLYLIGEGVRGFGPRVDAWRRFNHHAGELPGITWLPARPNLRAPEWAHAIATLAAETNTRLVVIDTLARTFGGGDENTSKDMGAYIQSLDTIKEHTGACVLVLHHTGKDKTAGSRGHSSLFGALDTELELANADDGIVRITTTAQKDQAKAQPLRFALVPAGDSLALAPYAGRNHPSDEPTGRAADALDALRAIAIPGGVTSTAWQETAEKDHGIPRSSFYAARSALIAAEKVQNLGSDQRPRYIPTDPPETP